MFKGKKKSSDDNVKATQFTNNISGSKVKKGDEWDAFKESQNNLFLDYSSDLKKRVKIANGGFAIALLGFFGAVGWHLTNPITEKVPYVLRVDQTTGAVDIMTAIKDQQISQNQAVDRYFVAEFIRNFEGYNYNTIQTTYDRTLAMSDLAVQNQYKKIYSGDYARHTVLGEAGNITVEITSVILDGNDQAPVARVRFKTITTKNAQPVTNYYIATVGYKYNVKSMSDDKRLLNPLGFTVTSYTISNEVAP